VLSLGVFGIIMALLELSGELLHLIFGYLNERELVELRAVCQMLKELLGARIGVILSAACDLGQYDLHLLVFDSFKRGCMPNDRVGCSRIKDVVKTRLKRNRLPPDQDYWISLVKEVHVSVVGPEVDHLWNIFLGPVFLFLRKRNILEYHPIFVLTAKLMEVKSYNSLAFRLDRQQLDSSTVMIEVNEEVVDRQSPLRARARQLSILVGDKWRGPGFSLENLSFQHNRWPSTVVVCGVRYLIKPPTVHGCDELERLATNSRLVFRDVAIGSQVLQVWRKLDCDAIYMENCTLYNTDDPGLGEVFREYAVRKARINTVKIKGQTLTFSSDVGHIETTVTTLSQVRQMHEVLVAASESNIRVQSITIRNEYGIIDIDFLSPLTNMEHLEKFEYLVNEQLACPTSRETVGQHLQVIQTSITRKCKNLQHVMMS
ncbi:hypothetical protein TRICI_005167, partial [Trichomonascus ciferrii]